MHGLLSTVQAVVGLILVVALVLWWLWRTLRRSEEPGQLIVKWVLTAGDLAFIIFIVCPLIAQGGYAGAFGGVPMAAVAGLIMAIIWTPSIAGYFGNKFGQLYDGGSVAPKPEPLYSMALAKRKQGRYAEAVKAVREQLARFPLDFEGMLLLAEIQADDLRDLPAALQTLEDYILQPEPAARNVAFALNRMADWQLKYSRDLPAARELIERIVIGMPDTPEAHAAQQRLAHLADDTQQAARHQRKPLAVPHSEERLGLRHDFTGLAPVVEAPAVTATKLVAHLADYPHDNEAREQLALIYAYEFHRLDLASGQLEELIAQRNAPSRERVRWLNLLADLYVKEGRDPASARLTLGRIVEEFAGTPAAENAERRLKFLRLEARRNEERPAMRMDAKPADAERPPVA